MRFFWDFEGKTTLDCRGSHLSPKTQIVLVDISQGICAVKKKSVNNSAIEWPSMWKHVRKWDGVIGGRKVNGDGWLAYFYYVLWSQHPTRRFVSIGMGSGNVWSKGMLNDQVQEAPGHWRGQITSYDVRGCCVHAERKKWKSMSLAWMGLDWHQPRLEKHDFC